MSEFLIEAIRLATENVQAGELPFGAVVVRAGSIVGRGVNTARRDTDPTAHAEVEAVRAACRTLGTLDLDGAILYSSCEPCAICLTVAAAAGVREIVYASPGSSVPDLGDASSPDAQALAATYQRTLVDQNPGALRQVVVPGADEPFRRWLELAGRS